MQIHTSVYIWQSYDLWWLPNLWRYFRQNLDIVVWFFISWQQIMLILVFPVKPPFQNDVFEATDHKYHLCHLRSWFSYVPSNTTNKKHIKINEKILRETWCLWGIILGAFCQLQESWLKFNVGMTMISYEGRFRSMDPLVQISYCWAGFSVL